MIRAISVLEIPGPLNAELPGRHNNGRQSLCHRLSRHARDIAHEGVIVARPEAITIATGHDGDGWRGAIQSRRFAGASFVYQVALADGVTVETSSAERLEECAPVTVRITEPVAMVA